MVLVRVLSVVLVGVLPVVPVGVLSAALVGALSAAIILRSSESRQARSSSSRAERQGTRAMSSRSTFPLSPTPSGVSTRFLIRRSAVLASRRARPRFSSRSAMAVTKEGSQCICRPRSRMAMEDSSTCRAFRQKAGTPKRCAICSPLAMNCTISSPMASRISESS